MAKREVSTFSNRLANKLKQMADAWTPGTSEAGRMSAGNAVGCWILQATTEISAASGQCATPNSLTGITPGSGTARICHRDRITGLLVPYRPNGISVQSTVYSLKKRKIANGGYFIGTRDLNGTIWVEEYFDFCPCEDTGTTLTVVTKVSFDTSNCKLVVCTRNICLPPGATVGDENCGGSGPSSGSGGTTTPGA